MSKLYIPKRFSGRIGYHVFVDRFYRAGPPPEPMPGRKIKSWEDSMPDWGPDYDGIFQNDYFYGGNLKGIIQKLDYLKSLSVGILYLSPISRSYTYHHYDVGDQTEIDTYIGDWEDFWKLCLEAHKRNILIIVDLVFNHMSGNSEPFRKALNGDATYRNWFEWDASNNPIYWYGFKDMPQCNKLYKEYQDYACKAAKKYVEYGADGIRLDLGEILPKEFILSVRNAAKSVNEEILFISEMWDSAVYKAEPQIYDGLVDSVMNYPLSDAISRWVRFGNQSHLDACMGLLAKYPVQVQDVLWNHLDTHDTPRELNILAGPGILENPFDGMVWDIERTPNAPWRRKNGDFDTFVFRKWECDNDANLKNNAIPRLKVAATIQYCMKGVPIVYYGTEAGVCGYKDPFSRKPYPWGHENADLVKHYMELGKMRSQNADVFCNGDQYENSDGKVLELVRRNEEGIIVLFANRTNEVKYINAHYPNSKVIFSLNGSDANVLQPYGGVICRF